MDDDVELHGVIVRPVVPAQVRVPIVLWSEPYFGGLGGSRPAPEDPNGWDNSTAAESVPVNDLVAAGYAVAMFNVRGTGYSGGCWSLLSPREQLDQVSLVEWLGRQPWSNGRVGMMGLSYGAMTAMAAAVGNPGSLKTIVVSGTMSDFYLFHHTPQGAQDADNAVYVAPAGAAYSLPPGQPGGPTHARDWTRAAPDRLCSELVSTHGAATGGFADRRDVTFYEERDFVPRMRDVTASVLLAHGFHDWGHVWQEDLLWGALTRAPKRQLIGHWGHQFPNYNEHSPEVAVPDWNQQVLKWFDFWLKGLGQPPGVGQVRYQDTAGQWSQSSAWPPAEAREEVLYLGSSLSPHGGETGNFRSVPLSNVDQGRVAFCPGSNEFGLLAVSEPLSHPVRLAGNPFAHLEVVSDGHAGFVGVSLLSIPDVDGCLNLVEDSVAGMAPWDFGRALSWGIADLRYHRGDWAPSDFPVGTRRPIRIDMTNTAAHIPAGNRLALLVYHGDATRTLNRGWYPRITISGDGGDRASHVVLPLVEGTLGGDSPTLTYAPRPRGPATSPATARGASNRSARAAPGRS